MIDIPYSEYISHRVENVLELEHNQIDNPGMILIWVPSDAGSVAVCLTRAQFEHLVSQVRKIMEWKP